MSSESVLNIVKGCGCVQCVGRDSPQLGNKRYEEFRFVAGQRNEVFLLGLAVLDDNVGNHGVYRHVKQSPFKRQVFSFGIPVNHTILFLVRVRIGREYDVPVVDVRSRHHQ